MTTTRRQFTWLAAGTLALAEARPLFAQPLRILRDGCASGPIDPDAPVAPSPELAKFASNLTIQGVARSGILTVLWLRGTLRNSGLSIATLQEASASGDIAIRERDRATVPYLVVENRGAHHVLMLAGEILLGGKQDRVVKEDVLLPPKSGPRHVEVYCVEQGRWAGATGEFKASGGVAAPSLRSRVTERAPQHQVWSEVDRYARALAAPSASGSYARVQESPEVKRQVREATAAPELRAPSIARGAAVFVGDRLAGIDAFEDARLFAREWPKLLAASAVDAVRARPGAEDEATLRDRVRVLLARATRVDTTRRSGVGTGTLVEFRLDTVRGSALVAEQQVIHLALL